MFRIGKEEADAVARVIASGQLFKANRDGLQEGYHFEDELREKFSVRHAIAMTSGKAAIITALTALGIGPGDEVIVPAYTYIASADSVLAAGAIPIIAECDETLTLDARDVERRITPRTRAILPVHMMGMPCNMDAIMEVAKKHNLLVIEDACQADGGSYHGKRLGTIGNAGTLSFNQFKIISAGEGGALLTDEEETFQRALIYQDSSGVAYFGNQLEGITVPTFVGTEYRTNEVAAAILRVQLSRLDGILADLRRVKKKLAAGIASVVKFAPSNDPDGDCGVGLLLAFDTEAAADDFIARTGEGWKPINSGRHVYTNWTPIVEKRGACNPALDPFKMEANKDSRPDYSPAACPRTLDLLRRHVFLNINPDMTDGEIDALAEKITAALR